MLFPNAETLGRMTRPVLEPRSFTESAPSSAAYRPLVWIGWVLGLIATLTGAPTAAETGVPPVVDGAFSIELAKRAAGEPRVGDVTLHAAELTFRIYQDAGNRPIWDDSGAAALLGAIDRLDREGLSPAEYRFPAIDRLLANRSIDELPVDERVDLELLLTEAFVRAAYNLAFGKVDAASLDPHINFTRPFSGEDPAPLLLSAIRLGGIEGVFAQLRPDSEAYEAMSRALFRYRALAAAGGWPSLAGGGKLERGMSGARVAALRERLRITGDDPSTEVVAEAEVFDAELEAAVEHYQRRMGLDPDGIVGPATLASLNIPVEARIDQIRVNLERMRWVLHEDYEELIVVDVAGFELFWRKSGEVIWRERVQVGKQFTSSPLFKSEMNRIEFNPSWTIPPGIMRRSVIPGVKKDPNYLRKKGFLLLTRDGKAVDPATVDFASLQGFPYMVRQPPGPNNALGVVKFLFPNPHMVYLHDTNHRELFDRTTRTFSSGCIRVRKPLELATMLLSRQGWTRERIDQVVASGKTQGVKLDDPIRIVIAYHTVVVRDGEVRFRKDVYDRDEKLLRALDGPFRVRRKDRDSSLGIS